VSLAGISLINRIRQLPVHRLILPVALSIALTLEVMGLFLPAGQWLYGYAVHQAYDWSWQDKATQKGVYNTPPILLAIDDASLRKLGHWPWSRATHAQVQTVFNRSSKPPSVVAWDIIFSEPQLQCVVDQASDGDQLFTNAINAAPYPVILAADFDVVTQPTVLLLPHQPFSTSKAKLAHVHVSAAEDGSVRQYFLKDNSFNSASNVSLMPSLPYFGKALFAPETAPALASIYTTEPLKTPDDFLLNDSKNLEGDRDIGMNITQNNNNNNNNTKNSNTNNDANTNTNTNTDTDTDTDTYTKNNNNNNNNNNTNIDYKNDTYTSISKSDNAFNKVARNTATTTDSNWFYPMPKDWLKVVSYEAVLSGTVPETIWANAPVLVAQTAQGLSDQHTSYIIRPSSIVAGGELVIAALHTEKILQAGLPRLHTAPILMHLAWTATLTVFVLFGLRRTSSFKAQALVIITALLATSALVIYRLIEYGEWINPWSTYLAIILLWMMWLSHKTQQLLGHLFNRSQAIRSLDALHTSTNTTITEFDTPPMIVSKTNTPTAESDIDNILITATTANKQLNIRLASLFTSKQSATTVKSGGHFLKPDVIDQQIHLNQLLENRTMLEFIRMNEILDLMPDAAFVVSQVSTTAPTPNAAPHKSPPILLRLNQHNQAAKRLASKYPHIYHTLNAPKLSLNELLLDFVPDLTPAQTSALFALTADKSTYKAPHTHTNHDSNINAVGVFTWDLLLTSAFNQNMAFAQGVEAIAIKGERYLIKLAHLSSVNDAKKPLFKIAQTTPFNWVLSVVDLSVSLALGQNRERTLSFLSHDLRSPQASILALIELYKKQHINHDNHDNHDNNTQDNTLQHQAELFKRIEFQAKRTLNLAEGFVQWSQATHGAAYQFVEYNLHELMIEAVDELWINAKQKNIQLIATVDEGDTEDHDNHLWVRIDRNLMWRAVVNLISNALHISKEGMIIRLSTYQVGGYAVIAVTDQGIGIPAEMQSRLFEPFAQGTGLKRTGAGLGLAFVKTVCEQHHGHVHVISPILFDEKPHGTCFELHIPLLDDAVNQTNTHSETSGNDVDIDSHTDEDADSHMAASIIDPKQLNPH
jgi:signal transduction histidine kinase/CHASE2 domain-containing sensor protein